MDTFYVIKKPADTRISYRGKLSHHFTDEPLTSQRVIKYVIYSRVHSSNRTFWTRASVLQLFHARPPVIIIRISKRWVGAEGILFTRIGREDCNHGGGELVTYVFQLSGDHCWVRIGMAVHNDIRIERDGQFV